MCRMQFVVVLVTLYVVGVAHSWDIVVSVGDQLEFYINGTKTDTVRFNSQHLAALAYDEVHNTVLYVDKQSNNDTIGRYNISSMEYKFLIQRNNRNIQGLAFDPASEKLFFTDTNERTINLISLKPRFLNSVQGIRLIKLDDGIPTDIAVDSCRGYIYWITTNLTTPKIERARFDGSERQVVINIKSLSVNETYKLEPHSLVIDQQTQKIFWVEPETAIKYSTNKADLNGKNKVTNSHFTFSLSSTFFTKPNVLAISKNSLYSLGWCTDCALWEETITGNITTKKLFLLNGKTSVGIAANYKIEQQIKGLQNCEALVSLVQTNSLMSDSLKTATQYDGPFCVFGTKVNGQSYCTCSPGFIGKRCDISVCENYCSQGTCSLNDEGLPKCSCNAGYLGERCDVSVCHGYCHNNGNCSLNENSKPVCLCSGNYEGDRCEVTGCLNYCMQGNCSFDDAGHATCRCESGYSGDRCEINVCHGYCLNNGDCSLNEEDEPACQCPGNYEGSRCEVDINNTTVEPTHDIMKQNVSLYELLFKSRKPNSKVYVVAEVPLV